MDESHEGQTDNTQSRVKNYITEENYPEFRRMYDAAIKRDSTLFEFEGQIVMREYARYVIMYVEGRAK